MKRFVKHILKGTISISGQLFISCLFSAVFFAPGCQKNEPPICVITSPEPDAKFWPGEEVNITVRAIDEDGKISVVDFYIDGILEGIANQLPYNFLWDTSEEKQGRHLIRIVAVDDGNLESEASVHITLGLSSPIISTAEILMIRSFDAVCTGELMGNGGAPVIEKGICWSESPHPGINNNFVRSPIVQDYYTITIKDLFPNTEYYVRAFARNRIGLSYGEELSFVTDEIIHGTFVDERDGNKYKSVKIGEQTWMAENLGFLPNVSQPEEYPDSLINYYVYDYEGNSISEAINTENYKNYGVLYNWIAATSDEHLNGHDVCPVGWHLPNDDEWKVLEEYAGMDSLVLYRTGYYRHSGRAGKRLKSAQGWNNGGNGTNASGFNAFPGGELGLADKWHIYSIFRGVGETASFWTSTEEYRNRVFINNYDGIQRGGSISPVMAFSIRCLKN